MMSDLLEIAAAAGIAIVDSQEDGADAKGNEKTVNENAVSNLSSDDRSLESVLEELNSIFCDRYTMADPGYVKVVEAAKEINNPPCVVGFNCWRRRDDRSWSRDRRGYSNRGNYRRHTGDRGDAWDRGDNRRQHYRQSYGDYQQRGYGSQPSRDGDHDHHSWSNANYQNRGYGYHQNRGNHGQHQNRQSERY